MGPIQIRTDPLKEFWNGSHVIPLYWCHFLFASLMMQPFSSLNCLLGPTYRLNTFSIFYGQLFCGQQLGSFLRTVPRLNTFNQILQNLMWSKFFKGPFKPQSTLVDICFKQAVCIQAKLLWGLLTRYKQVVYPCLYEKNKEVKYYSMSILKIL